MLQHIAMDEVLTSLPPELLSLILSNLSNADLKALSRASKRWHAAVARTLWQSVTFSPRHEFDLHQINAATFPQAPLQLVRHLHFRSSFEHNIEARCNHDSPDEGEDDDDITDRETRAVLRRLEDNQLHTFSWNFGTCLPWGILGFGGIIPLKQPFLQSLSLITNSWCGRDTDLDPSLLGQLRNLHWKAIHWNHVEALPLAIEVNKAHLRTLELDFVNWQQFRDHLDLSSDGEDGDDEETSPADSFFVAHVLGLSSHRLRDPLLPHLRVLSLTQAPLVASMVHAIDFDTLRPLTLRMCPGWRDSNTNRA